MLKSIQINIALIKKGETRGEGKKVIRKLKCATSRLLAFILALCMVCQVPAYAGPAEVTADGNEAAAIGGLAETEFTIEHVFGEERAVLTAKTRAGAKPGDAVECSDKRSGGQLHAQLGEGGKREGI